MNEIGKKTIQSYCEIDQMPRELRECVYEYGFAIVKACMMAGVTRPNMIRLLVREIWNGARQPGQRGKMAGVPGVYNTLDWILMQAGENISAATLARVLADNSYVVAPKGPTTEMVMASMSAIDGMGPLTKRRKHTIRLQAAMRAAEAAALRKTVEGLAA